MSQDLCWRGMLTAQVVLTSEKAGHFIEDSGIGGLKLVTVSRVPGENLGSISCRRHVSWTPLLAQGCTESGSSAGDPRWRSGCQMSRKRCHQEYWGYWLLGAGCE